MALEEWAELMIKLPLFFIGAPLAGLVLAHFIIKYW